MRRRASLLLALALLAACRRDPAKPEAFKPPADGRLTEAQVRLHLEGREAGFRPGEREWVRARMQEARLAGLTSGLDQKVIESRRRILRSLEERSRAATDRAKKAELDRDIAEVRRLLQGAPSEPPPAIHDNAELIARLKKETK